MKHILPVEVIQADWMRYLKGELSILDVQETDRSRKRAWITHKTREKAAEYMDALITIYEGMGNVTDKPEKQFAKIFTGAKALELLKAIHKARLRGWLYGQKLWDEKQANILARQLIIAGMDFEYSRLLKNRKYRMELIEKAGRNGIDLAFIAREIEWRERRQTVAEMIREELSA